MSFTLTKWRICGGASKDYSVNLLEILSVNLQSGSLFLLNESTNIGITLQYTGIGGGAGLGITLPVNYTEGLPWEPGGGSLIASYKGAALTSSKFKSYILMLGLNASSSSGRAGTFLNWVKSLDPTSRFACGIVWGESKAQPNIGASGYVVGVTSVLPGFVWYGIDVSAKMGYQMTAP